MKQSRNFAGKWIAVLSVVWMMIFLTGCETQQGVFVDPPSWVSGGGRPSEIFQPGDQVIVAFSTSPGGVVLINPHEERIKGDGTITPPHVGAITALGRSPLDVQKEVQEKLAKIYKNISVTVKAGERYFHVDGEVNRRGPAAYLGETDIVKAISAAGGFTDFANKKRVRLIRPNGKTDVINYNKAIEDPGYNVPVYPGDQVYVPRRLF
jgi:polysaccharide biosynthesis/export protein VpsN